MPLEVIGAGFGRTGTMSLHLALEKLGYPTHHMIKLMGDPTQDVGVWHRAFDDPQHKDEWEKVYGEYTAAVDWPTATYYEELSHRYPDAKFILTVRSAESWFKSMHNTIFAKMTIGPEGMPEHMQNIFHLMKHTSMDGIFEKDLDKIHDQEFMCKLFNDHNDKVKRTIPADRLLVYELGSGWEPLCKFLGKDVPDEPYPSTNSSDDFGNRFKGMVPDAGVRKVWRGLK